MFFVWLLLAAVVGVAKGNDNGGARQPFKQPTKGYRILDHIAQMHSGLGLVTQKREAIVVQTYTSKSVVFFPSCSLPIFYFTSTKYCVTNEPTLRGALTKILNGTVNDEVPVPELSLEGSLDTPLDFEDTVQVQQEHVPAPTGHPEDTQEGGLLNKFQDFIRTTYRDKYTGEGTLDYSEYPEEVSELVESVTSHDASDNQSQVVDNQSKHSVIPLSDIESFIRTIVSNASAIEEDDPEGGTTGARVEPSFHAADSASLRFREQRFLKVHVTETWTSLVMDVYDSIHYSYLTSWSTFTTVYFREYVTNVVALATHVMPYGVLECG